MLINYITGWNVCQTCSCFPNFVKGDSLIYDIKSVCLSRQIILNFVINITNIWYEHYTIRGHPTAVLYFLP